MLVSKITDQHREHGTAIRTRQPALKLEIVSDSVRGIHQTMRYYRMPDTRLMGPAAATGKLAADNLPIPLINAPPPEPGFAPGERPFVQSQQQKTDTEAVQDWESEGGASTHPSEDFFMKTDRNLDCLEEAKARQSIEAKTVK